jgi:hypothetical protein
MTKLFLAVAALAAMATMAHAGCGTKSLNGTWILQGVDDSTASEIVVLNGTITGVGTISQSKTSCKVTITSVGGTIKGRTENVAGTSRKPHLMTVYRTTDGLLAVLVRK